LDDFGLLFQSNLNLLGSDFFAFSFLLVFHLNSKNDQNFFLSPANA
jgi:hypothetical protein